MEYFRTILAQAQAVASDGKEVLLQALAALTNGTATPADVVTVALATGISTILLIVILKLLLPRGQAPSFESSLARKTWAPKLMGFSVAFVFFVAFGVWSYMAPLASASLAAGVISPEGSRKTVQHLEGGIVQKIHVREGDQVAEGDVMVTLDNVRARARVDELWERLVYLAATEARLAAELMELSEIEFPMDELESYLVDFQPILIAQQNLFKNREETQLARERILSKRVDQLREEIFGLEEVIKAQDEQMGLLNLELEASQSLHDRGLQRLPQLLALQRQAAQLKSEQALNRSMIARLEQQIGETELQLLATRQQEQEAISAELAEIRSQLAATRSQLPERLDALGRTTISAPISGRILNLRVTTERGGVLGAGGEVLDIVPAESQLVIDARVKPSDIENIYVGMTARVLLTAYSQRNLPHLYGQVTVVSADRLIDERSGEPYFLTKVIVDQDDVNLLGENIEIMSGMSADVMLLTGEWSLFDYLFKPVRDSLTTSFRER